MDLFIGALAALLVSHTFPLPSGCRLLYSLVTAGRQAGSLPPKDEKEVVECFERKSRVEKLNNLFSRGTIGGRII